MQTINPTTLATETIMLSSGVADYGQAMVYEESTGLIVLAAGNLIQHVTTAGTITSSIMAVLGDDDGYKGIVVDPNFVSIEEQLFVSTEVFPNPTNGELSIKNGLGIKSVYVYGIDGREVQQLETEAVRQVDLVLSSGAYLVKTVLSSGVSEIHRVLVN